jgi:phosphopantetheinyl transferase
VWCQKEAYLKARGEGIGAGLDHFDVIADPEEGGGIRADRKDPDAMRRWRLRSLDAPAGFRAALAWEGNASELHQREWTE